MAEATVQPQTITPAPKPQAAAARGGWLRGFIDAITVPVLAVFTALLVSGIFIAFTDEAVLALLPGALSHPLELFRAIFDSIFTAYLALFQGAFGQPTQIIAGFITWIQTGNPEAFYKAIYPISESIVTSTPYIFTGLAVAVGFKAGLFNIGAEGQLFMGAIGAAFVGYTVTGLPWFIHLPLAIFAGILAGAFWGAIPGYLKAKTGAHEVINTIMLNYIAFLFADWLLNGPMKAQGGNPRSPEIAVTAYLPTFFPPPLRVHWGFILAIGVAALVWWFLFKTTIGFELRTVGASATAAKYAGINISRMYVMAMAISGGLAGLAGANELLGVNHFMANAFSPGYGFDSIALALLGRSNPFGVVLAALLFGFLRSGATRMQSVANVPIDIISIVQAFIIVFIAAPEIVRYIYRVRTPKNDDPEFQARGWV